MEHTHDGGCPSCSTVGAKVAATGGERVLQQWPIQIKLIGTVAPFLNDADLMVAADCTGFAVKGFHEKFLGEKKLLIGCPKLDNAQIYVDKFTEIFTNIPVKSVTCLRMEVPCCGGMSAVLAEAIRRSGKKIPFKEIVIGVKGDTLSEKDIAL